MLPLLFSAVWCLSVAPLAGDPTPVDPTLAADAAAVIDVFSNHDALSSPDGKSIVFSSNRGGVSQIYLASTAHPAEPARALTTTADRAVSPGFSPDGKYVYFSSDQAGDENYDIERVPVAGGKAEKVSGPEKQQYSSPFFPARHPDQMVFSARDIRDSSLRVYSQSLRPGAAPVLRLKDPGGSDLMGVNPEASQVILLRKTQGYDSSVVLGDLKAGTTRVLYPPAGKHTQIVSADFSLDGTRVLVATDDAAEKGALLALDSVSGREVARYEERSPPTAMVNDFVSTGSGKVLALVGAGSHSELRVLDGKTLALVRKIDMPLGDGELPQPQLVHREVIVGWSTPGTPMDVHAVDVETGAVRALRTESRASLARMGAVHGESAQVTSFDGTVVPVNVYLPEPRPAKLPVIVWMHGGPPDVATFGYSDLRRFFLAEGFALVAPNVRGSSGYGRAYVHADDGPLRMNAVKDMAAVNAWVKQQPWADAGNVIVAGSSYGGYMTLMGLAFQPTLWRAGVDISGIYDWRTFMKVTSGMIHDIFEKEVGTDPAFLASVSPASRVADIRAPLFVYAGAKDPRVPRSEADALVRAVRKHHVPCEYMVSQTDGHGTSTRAGSVELFARTVHFLRERLVPENAGR